MERTRLQCSRPPAEDLDDEVEEVRENEPDAAAISPRSPRTSSRLTNGPVVLAGVDGRSSWARRFRDLVQIYTDDLGGQAAVSEAQRALVRRAATLSIQLETLESTFATADGVDAGGLDLYLRSSSLLHRVLASLGLEKSAASSAPARHADPVTNELIRAIREGRGLT